MFYLLDVYLDERSRPVIKSGKKTALWENL